MDARGTLQVASGAMLIAVTASLAASVSWVAFEFGAEPGAMVIGQRDERRDAWTAIHREGDVSGLTWKADDGGVRYAVDDDVGPDSPLLSTVAEPMPHGRVYAFCADGPSERVGWGFTVISEDRVVSDVAFAVILPCGQR